MNFSKTNLNKDMNEIYMRNYKESQEFNRYMYMYNLFLQNHKLQIQLNQTQNQIPIQPQILQPIMPYPLVAHPNQLLLQQPFFNMYHPFQILNQQSQKIKSMQLTDDKIDTTIKNVIIIVQNSKNEIIVVKKINTDEWMLPEGTINDSETPFNTALRIFRDNTTFDLNTASLRMPIKYSDIKHSNQTITRVFKVYTTQQFGVFTPTTTTSDLMHGSLKDIKTYIAKLENFNANNLRIFTILFRIGFI